MSEQILLTPGPTPIPPESLKQESLPIIHHRTQEFAGLFDEFQENLKYVFQTKQKVHIFASSGTGGMECAVVNLISPKDKAIVASCGAFGDRWIKLLTSFGANVVSIKSEWGSAVHPEDLEKTLKEHPDAVAVFSTHTDTSTATACDIKRYGAIVSKTKAVLVVDAISGLAGQELLMDEWNCDVVVAASQKGLMAAPGLAFISVSPKAQPLVANSKSPRFYWDLNQMEKAFKIGQTPFTPAISLIRATNASLKIIRQRTLPTILQDIDVLARFTREAGKSLGLSLFSKDPCQVLTSFVLPEGIDGETLIQSIVKQYNISLAGGQEKLKGKVVRVAHMGHIKKAELQKGMDALAQTLQKNAVSGGA